MYQGIEDIAEECSSLYSHPGTLHLTTMYKVTTPSIDSGNPDSSPPGLSLYIFCKTSHVLATDRNHLFMADILIERRHSASTRLTRYLHFYHPLLLHQPLLSTSEMKGLRSQTLSVGEELLPSCEDLLMPAPVSTCPSPASSEGGIYSLVSHQTG